MGVPSACLAILGLLALADAVVDFSSGDGCTSIVVGKDASVDGAPMTTHSDDCLNCDMRLSKVPAMDHPEGSKRPVYHGRAAYPRFLGEGFGETYLPENTELDLVSPPWEAGEGEFAPMGYIPQAPHTYAYLDGGYGIQNEFNLAIGESTCGGRLTALPIVQGGEALVDVITLSRVALERCKTARCAIALMGSLAEEYGYYGMDETTTEAGESLQVTDLEEAWIFHIMADDTGTSAVWVAQRVPSGHISAVANQFVIREVHLDDEENFMGSSNMEEVARRAGLWPREAREGREEGCPAYGWQDHAVFDWTAAFAVSRAHLAAYATRRIWRIFTLAAPSIRTDGAPEPGKLSPLTNTFADDYPFSVAPDAPLSVQDILTMHRDHYEGTPYDLTAGIEGGPYGDPSRFDPSGTPGLYAEASDAIDAVEAWSGAFERSISMYRAVYTWVSQTRARPGSDGTGLGVVWFGQYAAHASQFTPIYTLTEAIPPSFGTGSLYHFDETVAYWVHAAVGNWADRFYVHTIGDIKALQAREEARLEQEQQELDAKLVDLMEAGHRDEAAKCATEQVGTWAAEDVATWWAYFKHLMAHVKDGQKLVRPGEGQTLSPTKLFYPRWWLETVDFFPSRPAMLQSAAAFGPSVPQAVGMAWAWGLAAMLLGTFAIGYRVGKRSHQAEYQALG